MKEKSKSFKIGTIVLVSLIVAVIVSLVTATITGNVIRQNNNPLGLYKVYTKSEIDTKLANVPTRIGVLNMLNSCSIFRTAGSAESLILKLGIRSYASVLTETFSGLIIPLTQVPVEVLLATPIITALIIPFYKYMLDHLGK